MNKDKMRTYFSPLGVTVRQKRWRILWRSSW